MTLAPPARHFLVPLAIVVFLCTAATAPAATLLVDASDGDPDPVCGSAANKCESIQMALAQASPGDTIDVAAGAYSGPVVVDKSVLIRGAQHGIDARMPRSPGESVVTGGFSIVEDFVTIDGFTVQDAEGAGITLSGTGTDRIIRNNIVRSNVFGLYLNGADADVQRNLFHDNNDAGSAAGNGIYSDQGATNAAITENRFTGRHQNASIIFAGSGSPAQSGIAITDNQLVGDSLVYLINTAGVSIEGNLIDDSQFHAIQLDGGNVGVEVTGNELVGSDWSAVRVSAFNSTASNGGVTIVGNTLTDQGDHAIKLSDAAHAGTLRVEFNRIARSGLSSVLNEDVDDEVDARHNWWGCNDGCDDAQGDVNTSARLLLELTAAPSVIKTGGETSALTADLTRTSSGDDFASMPFPPAPVTFTSSLGTTAPGTSALANGLASSTLTSTSAPGTATVTAALDGENATDTVQINSPPVNSALPEIQGAPRDGETLTATDGTWSGSPPPAFTYQWQRCDTATTCQDVAGATTNEYDVTAGDVGKTLRVEVTATNAAGDATALSDPTAEVEGVPPANSAPPTVAGTAGEGETLTATQGTWTGTTPLAFSYQWRRCDAAGANCGDIAGATGTAYTLSAADPGSTIRVDVTAQNVAGETTARSAPTATVAAKPEPPQQQQQQEQPPPEQQQEQPLVDTSGPSIGVVRRRLRLSRRGVVEIRVFCPADETDGCPVEATVDSAAPVRVRGSARRRKRQVRFGTSSVVIPPGRLSTVEVRFTRRGRQIARRLRKVRVTVTVVSRDALGNATTVALPFTLVAPR